VLKIIRSYTMEFGVLSLERQIATPRRACGRCPARDAGVQGRGHPPACRRLARRRTAPGKDPVLPAQTRPSAGVAITTALLSAARGVAVHPGHTMTGEITLTGRILPVGGIKEKVLAAHRNPFIHVLLPEGNRKDIEELPREVRSAITFLFSETIQDALVLLFPPAS